MTTDAPSLFDALATACNQADDADNLDNRFDQFHAAHPEVYAHLVRLARQGIARGRTRLGIGQLFEVLRWETNLGDPDSEYRLNNSLRSRYARLIAAQEPDLTNIFETRELRT